VVKVEGIYGFFKGMMMGSVCAVVVGAAILYALNMTHVVAISVPSLPHAHVALNWAYDNLRLSIIPFGATILLYTHALFRLRRLLSAGDVPPAKIAQAERLVDIWINLFFGIGVIWTAIGMRSALLEGLGGLDAAAAAKEGAFRILRRLVDGGILIALSTTIFGAVGGYVMRIAKTLSVGAGLDVYYHKLSKEQDADVRGSLGRIEDHLSALAKRPMPGTGPASAAPEQGTAYRQAGTDP